MRLFIATLTLARYDMTNAALSTAIENIYTSIHNGNEDLDIHIAALKQALDGEKTVVFEPTRLVENTREGRRMMQSYFKRRGIIVKFS